uniref:Uncharacterized protein n=1 Tax=Onchocerca volvulus TaxID=6282 RepID=A0A8R1TJJ8_ONCVO
MLILREIGVEILSRAADAAIYFIKSQTKIKLVYLKKCSNCGSTSAPLSTIDDELILIVSQYILVQIEALFPSVLLNVY